MGGGVVGWVVGWVVGLGKIFKLVMLLINYSTKFDLIWFCVLKLSFVAAECLLRRGGWVSGVAPVGVALSHKWEWLVYLQREGLVYLQWDGLVYLQGESLVFT